jgi:hypothetical protein
MDVPLYTGRLSEMGHLRGRWTRTLTRTQRNEERTNLDLMKYLPFLSVRIGKNKLSEKESLSTIAHTIFRSIDQFSNNERSYDRVSRRSDASRLCFGIAQDPPGQCCLHCFNAQGHLLARMEPNRSSP